MVLVSNEWLNNKDDAQKSTNATELSSTTATSVPLVEGNELNVNVHSAIRDGISNGLELSNTTHKKRSHSKSNGAAAAADAAAEGKRQRTGQGSNSNSNKQTMDVNKSDEDTLDMTAREKHENETREQGDSIDGELDNSLVAPMSNNLEADNNNLEQYSEQNGTPCDSNTNTLQALGQQLQQPPLTQQALHMALNSVINSNGNNATTTATLGNAGSLFSSLGMAGLNNGALQQQQQQLQLQDVLSAGTCSTLLVSPTPSTEVENSSVDTNGEAKIVLQCEPKSHKFDARSILLMPNQECKVGRLIAKSKASEGNAIFDCKVLSRNHAILWYTADGHFWVKDTKSSNGTFINDNKLGTDPAELHFGDTVKFGVEVIENSRQEVHGCIIARVTLFLPDGREAISIGQDQVQLAGPNCISFDEIQRLNAFMQEAAQREKMLKAKLSSLQNVLDSTRKNSAMCWQSMITEDQLLHKINLLEKKLQVMEKNVPENALRNEIVKMLEDKTSYQLTAKEALRKVYQERCDAMQMLSKMEMACTSSENECTLLRAQILTSKQTLHDFNMRLEQLQQEYLEYKQETLRQQQEAKALEEERLQQLKEQLCTNEREAEELRLQLTKLQQTMAEQDKEQELQELHALERLDAAIADMGGDNDDDDDDDDDDDEDNDANNKALASAMLGEALAQDKSDAQPAHEKESNGELAPKVKSLKKKKGKKNKDKEQQVEFDLKHKVVRKSTVMKWLKNSDLNKGEHGSDILKAIFNDAESGGEEQEPLLGACELSAGASSTATKQNNSDSSAASSNVDAESEGIGETASDEFVHKSPKHGRLNGSSSSSVFDETEELQQQSKLRTQATLVCDGDNLSQDQALEMLQAECEFYKEKSASLNNDIAAMQQQMNDIKEQLQQKLEESKSSASVENCNSTASQCPTPTDFERELADDLASMNNAQVEREEELIVYKERLEQSENSNVQLRNEISMLRLKREQPIQGHQLFMRRALPFGCMALAAIVYFLTSRF